jgi:pyruvate,water dikinase
MLFQDRTEFTSRTLAVPEKGCVAATTYDYCEHLSIPSTIVCEPLFVKDLKYAREAKSELEGTGCNSGIVTGRARVVQGPSECLEFEEGEILVAPITTPGWALLCIIAGGLVMELGSTISHGAVIAREFGIPVVAGVENATKIIQTGQLLVVDGAKGTVHIKEG